MLGQDSKIGEVSQPSSDLSDQIAHPDPQRVGDDLEGIERHALAPILQPVEMNTIQAGEFGKLILRDSFLHAQFADSFPNRLVDVCPDDVLQPIRLWVYAARKHPAYKQLAATVMLGLLELRACRGFARGNLRSACATELPTASIGASTHLPESLFWNPITRCDPNSHRRGTTAPLAEVIRRVG